MSDQLSEMAREIRQRCLALQVAAWSLDARGRIVGGPLSDGTAGTWTESRPLAEAIVSLGRRALREAAVEPESFAPGAWLIATRYRNESDDAFATVGLTFDPSPNATETLAPFAEGTRRPSADDVAPFTGAIATDPDRLSQMIQWWHDDLGRAHEAATVNSGLLRELDSAFEQISTLYRIARAMNCLSDPEEFVRGACHQLSFLLGFGWAAVQYVDSPFELPQLKQLVAEGDLPCSRAEFSQLALTALAKWNSDQWTHVLEPDQCDMARTIGTQVLVEPITHDDILIGALFVGGLEERQIDSSDLLMTDTVGDFMGTFHQNAMRFAVQDMVFKGTVRAMSSAIDAKDAYTRGHSERVASLAVELARATGMSETRCDVLYISGLLHDVGKIGVPENILGKAGSLTDEEFEQIKLHPVIGHTILNDIPTMADALPGVLHHHERWDGRGYPHGLTGTSIPLFGRLLALADAFDAMSSDRAYRSRMDRAKVLSIIREGAGSQWDPDLSEAFLRLDLSRYDDMLQGHAELEVRAA